MRATIGRPGILLFLVGLAALLALAIACEEEIVERPAEAPEAAPAETPEATPTPEVAETPTPVEERPGIGATQEVGDARVTLNGWREDPSSEFLKPDEGFKWIVVDLTVENTGDDEYSLSTLLQMQARDEEDRTYDIAFGPELRGSLDVVIPVGEQVRGEVAFEVPAGTSTLRFIFKQAIGVEQAIWYLDLTTPP